MFCFVVFCCLCFCRLVVCANTDPVKMLSVMEGESVTLQSNITEIQKRHLITWTFGLKTTKIAEIEEESKKFSTYDDVLDGRFRGRLKLDNQTGSLTITHTRTEDSGEYTVIIKGRTQTIYRFNLTVYAPLPVPVIISNSSNCSSNCSLVCSVLNVSHVTLSWFKGNSLLSSISVSDLSISLSLPLEVEYQDKNTYSCVLNNPISNQTQHLDITQLCHTCAGHPIPPISAAAAAGIAAAAVGFLLLVAVGIFCIYRKHRKTDQDDQARNEEITYADPTFYKRKAQKSGVKTEEEVVYAGVAGK
ncbi:CD48 antigen-like isoform X2 [Pseudorasbora parva]|uniref:CD48 antigen-like isoform X2 n=1 Tax=Pseudorasbora parva TaxID=51549 RepID=UPI00351F3A4F